MNMRYGSKEEYDRFSAFCNESKRPVALDDINFSSPVLVQIITYHLYNEYMIENWIKYKFANGASIFEGANFTTKSKLTLARNMGLPNEIYKAATLLNNIRNKYAHNINEKPIDDETLSKLIQASDNINLNQNTYASLYPHQKNAIDKLSEDDKIKHKLFLVLSTMSLKIWNFLFIDMHLSNSHELK